MPSRHRGKRFDFDMHYADVPRFERLTAGCKTPRERVLKLMEIVEKSIDVKVEENEKIKSLTSQINKLLDDLKKQPQTKVEIREVPKYIDRIVEKPIYVDRIVEKVIEKPVEVQKTGEERAYDTMQTEKLIKEMEELNKKPVLERIVEKTVYVGDDDWLPEYWPFDTKEEYKAWLNDF